MFKTTLMDNKRNDTYNSILMNVGVSCIFFIFVELNIKLSDFKLLFDLLVS